MIRRLAVLLVVLAIASTAFAARTVRGQVIDKTTSQPYAGAGVTLENPEVGRSATVYSDQNGMFYLRDIPPGTYTLEVKTARTRKSYSVSIGGGELSDLAPVSIN